MIRALSKDAVQPLAAAQVIVDLAAAVKELIENALDANASAISKAAAALLLRRAGSACVLTPL